jgi:type III secretion protein Q
MHEPQAGAMSNAGAAPWSALPRLTPKAARTHSRLAALCGLSPWPVRALGERYWLQWHMPLSAYPVTFQLRVCDDSLRIGCDLAGVLPEFSAPGLRQLLATHDGDAEALAYLFSEWLDLFGDLLGQSVDLDKVFFDEPWPGLHWAATLTDSEQHVGTLAVAGGVFHAALDRFELRPVRRYQSLGSIPVSLSWRVSAPALSASQLSALARNSVLLLNRQPAELCLPGRGCAICLRGHEHKGGFVVQSVDLKRDEHFQSDPIESGLLPLDMIMASIDVLLDTLVMPLSEIGALAPGGVLTLSQLKTGRAVTLRCNGAPFARGEIIAVGERLGVLITQKAGVVESLPRPAPARKRRAGKDAGGDAGDDDE